MTHGADGTADSILSDASLVLEAARDCRLVRRAVLTLAARLPDGASSLVGAAYAEHGPHAATVLAFACVVRGWAMRRTDLLALLPEVENIGHALMLMQHSEEGFLDLIQALIKEDRLSTERAAMALHLVSLECEPATVPTTLIARLRGLARYPGSGVARLYVTAAANELGDEEVLKLTGRMSRRDREEMRQATEVFRGTVEQLLPEREPPRLISGYTVKKPEPKPGRNDPCPCRSGKKYKKCCGRPGATPSRPPSPSGVDERHLAPGGARLIGEEQFDLLRPHELMKLDPRELSSERLIRGWRRLATFRRWEAAEGWVRELAMRADQLERASDWWQDLADQALSAGKLELAERCRSHIDEDDLENVGLDLQLRIARHDDELLIELERALATALKEESWAASDDLYSIAYALLDHYPALGLLFARGCLSRDRHLDNEMLMNGVEAVRDRLGLSVEDPFWEVTDWMLEQRLDKQRSRQIAELRDRMQQSREEVRQLKAELELTEERLQRAEHSQEVTSLAKSFPAQRPQAQAQDKAREQRERSAGDQERVRLRERIADLKQLLKEGARERQVLRQDVRALKENARHAGRESEPPSTRDGATADELEEACAVETAIPLRRPRVDENQLGELRDLEGGLGAKAIQRLAELASGDSSAWRQVKRLRAKRELFSMRLGIHHRMLFTLTPSELRLRFVVHRKELERVVLRPLD